MNELALLTEKVCAFRDARNWKQFHNMKDMAISLSLEAAELLELVQWKRPEELENLSAAQREQLNDELADVLFWVLIIAHDRGVDLMQAVDRKMVKNEQKYPVEKARNNRAKYTEF